jgi:hypothetical protein
MERLGAFERRRCCVAAGRTDVFAYNEAEENVFSAENHKCFGTANLRSLERPPF